MSTRRAPNVTQTASQAITRPSVRSINPSSNQSSNESSNESSCGSYSGSSSDSSMDSSGSSSSGSSSEVSPQAELMIPPEIRRPFCDEVIIDTSVVTTVADVLPSQPTPKFKAQSTPKGLRPTSKLPESGWISTTVWELTTTTEARTTREIWRIVNGIWPIRRDSQEGVMLRREEVIVQSFLSGQMSSVVLLFVREHHVSFGRELSINPSS
ncbi:hypothetical protein K461DRAFT_302301 [Myriangium duriaei CBS 260.36]|uniref:Uncharacterized protein n=1 Tax=Myriangium duriaei CBS 260.36 TaxID=1168546 RepID=A0A9P4IQR4_9PEZI|nr:hypothetical protein K461DRAFT_302301 [Myriangium duriaei CBS 260.36]